MTLDLELSRLSRPKAQQCFPESPAGITLGKLKNQLSLFHPAYFIQPRCPSSNPGRMIYCLSTQSTGHVPAAWASPGSLLDTWSLRLYLRPTDSKSESLQGSCISCMLLFEKHQPVEYLWAKMLFRCVVLFQLGK